MPIAFQDLTDSLLQYKQSIFLDRNESLDNLIKELLALPEKPKDQEEAKLISRKLAYISQQITYVNNLRKIENQEFVDMLGDYNELGTFFTNNGYADLSEYFDIQKFKWRLKKPIEEIPQTIWDLFHAAQVAFLKSKGKQDIDIRPIDCLNRPQDQLYPLPQMFFNYQNEAVDRIYVDTKGQFNMMVGPLGIQCPGGGMMPKGASAEDKAAQLEALLDEKRHQMLDEYLEEENANLFNTAAKFYNEILDQNQFKARLVESFSKKEFAALPDFEAFKIGFLQIIGSPDAHSNAELLAKVVAYIETYIKTGDDKQQSAQRKLINTLRATVQVETFKLHPIYEKAFQFVKDHSQQVVEIDQVNDVRRGGGHQTASTFLMNEPLEHFFAAKDIQGQVPGDDMTDGKYQRFTLLKLLSNFNKVRFSHIMTVLAGQEAIFDQLDFEQMWSNEDYSAAKKALTKGAYAAQADMINSHATLNDLRILIMEKFGLSKCIQDLLSNVDNIIRSEMVSIQPIARNQIRDLFFLLNGWLTLDDYRQKRSRDFITNIVDDGLLTLTTGLSLSLNKIIEEAILNNHFGAKERQKLMLQNNHYQDAYDRLRNFFDEEEKKGLSSEIERMLDTTEALRTNDPEKDRSLTEALYHTVFLLEGSEDVHEYKTFTDTIQQGKSSTGLKVLGGIMIGICALAIAALITLFAAPAVALAVTATLGASFVMTSSVTGGIAVTTGFASGVSFFASRHHGLSKAADDIYDAMVDNQSPCLEI